MIYTVTLDPMLDRVVRVEELVYDDINHITEDRKRPAGKGIDISRIIKEMGGETISLGFTGGYTGLELMDLLAAEGIKADFTRIKGETRSSLTIFQEKKKIQTLLYTAQPVPDQSEIDSFCAKIDAIPGGSSVIISGLVPPGMKDDFFADMIRCLKKRDIKVFFDSDREALRLGVEAGPYMIKPNIFELNRLAGSKADSPEEIKDIVKPFQDSVECIIVSLGARGAVGFSKEGNYYAKPPRVNRRNSSGAGDSLLGGFAFVLTCSGSFEESLKIGVACGTATAMGVTGTIGSKNDINSIKKEVIIEKF
jgi:1-phosphofructokinase family hexose kinase